MLKFDGIIKLDKSDRYLGHYREYRITGSIATAFSITLTVFGGLPSNGITKGIDTPLIYQFPG